MKAQSGVGQPLLQLADGLIAPVVEMRARSEQLDRLESVRGNVREVVALQPVTVKQVSRDAESVHAWLVRSFPW
jgi:hypothetical protein